MVLMLFRVGLRRNTSEVQFVESWECVRD